MFTDCPFLYIDNKHHIQYGSDMHNFSEHKHREITPPEILSLELTEPIYRPFINAIECFNEMKKHEPFGWLYGISSHNYILVSEIGTEGVYAPNGLYNFNKAKCELYFADGTPFGMKV